MFGSDWPVCELAAPYRRVKDVLAGLLGGLRADVFGANAARVYRLPPG
jgi:L-fuconolactonase